MNVYSYEQMKLLLEFQYISNMYDMTTGEISDRLPGFMKDKKKPSEKVDSKKDDARMKPKEAEKPARNMFEISIDSPNKKLLKSMFRKISKYLHPDKTSDIQKHEAFNDVKKSTNNGFLYLLFLKCLTFNLPIRLNDELVDILKIELVFLKQKLKQIQHHPTLT